MSRMRQIRKEAPALLEATKAALRYLRAQDAHSDSSAEAERQKIMEVLVDAIDLADPALFDESLTSVKLVMGPPTWEFLEDKLRELGKCGEFDAELYEMAKRGVRATKQRIYLTLPINHRYLRRLQFILRHMKSAEFEKPFGRIAKQIEEEGLSKNPMEILAQQGL